MNYQRFLLMLSDIWENWITSTWVRTTSLFSEMEPSLVSTESLDYLFMITRFTGSTEMLSMDLSSKILFSYWHWALVWFFMLFKVHKPSNLSIIFLPKFQQTFFPEIFCVWVLFGIIWPRSPATLWSSSRISTNWIWQTTRSPVSTEECLKVLQWSYYRMAKLKSAESP